MPVESLKFVIDFFTLLLYRSFYYLLPRSKKFIEIQKQALRIENIYRGKYHVAIDPWLTNYRRDKL